MHPNSIDARIYRTPMRKYIGGYRNGCKIYRKSIDAKIDRNSIDNRLMRKWNAKLDRASIEHLSVLIIYRKTIAWTLGHLDTWAWTLGHLDTSTDNWTQDTWTPGHSDPWRTRRVQKGPRSIHSRQNDRSGNNVTAQALASNMGGATQALAGFSDTPSSPCNLLATFVHLPCIHSRQNNSSGTNVMWGPPKPSQSSRLLRSDLPKPKGPTAYIVGRTAIPATM